MKILKIPFSRTIKTFANQHKIPRLPIPQLDKTVDKYLKSLEPIVDGNQLENSVKVANEFKNGFGKELQQRLVDYDKTQKNSWLETLWLENAYLKWREPSMINVNWWCEFKDHPEQPKELLIKKPPPGVISSFQVMRAAGLITNFLNFNDFLNREEIPAESIKGNPLCMAQYKNLFGTTRISGETMDKLLHQYPTTSQHIIVMIKGQMYKVDVYANNKRVPLKELERVLLAVSKETLETEQQPAVGILTAGHRDNTFKGMNELRRLSEQNAQNLNIIETALFVVCLDDHSSKKNIDQSHLQIFHNRNGSNRWFDKSMQLIIGNNGRAGLNGEHSPADAVVPGTIVDYVIQNEPAVDPEESTNEPLAYPIKLIWTINDVVSKCLDEAGEVAQKLIDDTESCLLQTDIYGSRFIKEVASASPDAYIQLVLQLAYYRMYKKPTAVYESASTRFFLHGRTETGRSMSNESLAFIQSFDNDDILYAEKRKMFADAIKSQSSYMKDAASGKGVDRHLLGLRMMIKLEESDKTSFFKDPSYLDSMNFRLSTSNMSPGKNFYGGFGPVVHDGYGINYAIDKDNLKFSISSKVSCQETNSFKFRELIERSLIDLMILFPKRSQVWGYNWKENHAMERKEEYQLTAMRKLSDELKKKQALLAERYRQK